MKEQRSSVNRRSFVKSTAAGLAVMSAGSAFGASANSAMTIGLIGCGGRGNHDARNFVRHTNSRVIALADFYQDRLDETKSNFPDGKPKTFLGFQAYKDLLATNVDAVIITSPPYFHPDHFAAAMDAGKHVYLEKPVAIDTVGAHKVLEAGKKADSKRTVMVGFQTRYAPDMIEAVKRVHDGAIGGIVCGHGHYHSGWLSPRHKETESAQDQRIRNWVFDIVLSGDILVEQNIHILDVCNWIIGAHPEKAFGTGGRKVRTAVGDTWDHYGVTYWYPGGVELVFASTQFLNLGWGDAGERFNGSKGAFDALAGHAKIRGDNEWSYDGPEADNEALKIQAFHKSVMDGKYLDEIPQGVESTLTAIMGRTSAYRGKEYTWKEMIDENEHLDANLKL